MSLFAPYSDENERLKKKLACLKTCRSFSNSLGALISPYSFFPTMGTSAGSININASGESVTLIGQLRIADGSDQKTFSSAGGKVHFNVHTGNVFSDPGTTLRAGIQDLTLTGVEDGVFDVYGDFIGGTDPITDTSGVSIPIGTGSRVITNGEVVAISIEMVTRAGADNINIGRRSISLSATVPLFPYYTLDSGSGPTKFSQYPPAFVIGFDDGTIGYMGDLFPFTFTQLFLEPSSTPNEYASVFTLPVTADLSGIEVLSGNGGGDLEVGIYSNPLGLNYPYGLPQLEWSKTIEGDNTSGNTSSFSVLHVMVLPKFRLVRNRTYAISVKPTTGSVQYLPRMDFGDSSIKQATPLGENWSLGTRNDNTSPFTLSSTRLMPMALYLSDIYC